MYSVAIMLEKSGRARAISRSFALRLEDIQPRCRPCALKLTISTELLDKLGANISHYVGIQCGCAVCSVQPSAKRSKPQIETTSLLQLMTLCDQWEALVIML